MPQKVAEVLEREVFIAAKPETIFPTQRRWRARPRPVWGANIGQLFASADEGDTRKELASYRRLSTRWRRQC